MFERKEISGAELPEDLEAQKRSKDSVGVGTWRPEFANQLLTLAGLVEQVEDLPVLQDHLRPTGCRPL